MNATVWEKFSLAENDPDPGGGMLYAVRYDSESLLSHQAALIRSLQDLGLVVDDLNGELVMHANRELSDEEIEKMHLLAQELSVTNEAVEYIPFGFTEISTIEELTGRYKELFYQSLGNNDPESAVSILQRAIPQVVSDIMVAQATNEPLSREDYERIEELGRFATKRISGLRNKGMVFIGFGNDGATIELGPDDLIY